MFGIEMPSFDNVTSKERPASLDEIETKVDEGRRGAGSAAVSVDEFNETAAAYDEFKSAQGGMRKKHPMYQQYMDKSPKERGDTSPGAEFRWKVANFIESEKSRIFFVTLVVMNAVMIGVEADWTNSDTAAAFDWIEFTFLVFFTIEIILKLFGFGKLFWTDTWNLIDFTIVAASIVEAILEVISDHEGNGLSSIRLVRVMRIIRIVSFLNRLALLVNAFIWALESVMYVALLIILFIYIFAILGNSFFGNKPTLQRDVMEASGTDTDDLFGTILRSMASLLQVMTLDSWMGQITRPISDQQPMAWAYFLIFFMVGSLGLLNLLTAIFIDALTQLSDEDAASKLKSKKDWMHKVEVLTEVIFKELRGGDDEAYGVSKDSIIDKGLPGNKNELAALNLDVGFVKKALNEYSDDPIMSEEDFVIAVSMLEEETCKRDVWQVERHVKIAEKELCSLEASVKEQMVHIDKYLGI